MGRIRVIGHRSERGRCAYCRDDIAAEGAERCGACGTLTHASCLVELNGCPTFACEHASPRAVRARAERAGRAPAADPSPARGRRRRRRRTSPSAGRVTREVPGLWGRFGPYSRMVVKTLLSIVFLQLLLAGALYAIAHPHETVDAFMRGKGGGKSVGNLVGHAFITLLMGGIGCFYAVSWLRRLGSVWTRVGELLDDGEVLPMRMRVLTRGSGKTRTTFIALDPLEAGGWRLRETEVGMFMPWWVRRKENERVYVHGAEGPGPYVVEFSNGLLTLLDPD